MRIDEGRVARWPDRCLRIARRLLVAVGFAVAGSAGVAQTLESALAPGKLIQGHAKWEHDCKACHVRFDRNAQDGLCMDCHKDVGQDVRAHAGFHGRLKPQACRSCHTEHKGADARIAAFDTQRFDHAATDFALRGSHARVECAKCHTAGRKYRDAPADCNACHRKDDVHKGVLGARCADCHGESSWKEARIDHDKTRFPLLGKHIDTKCAACHKDKDYRSTPRQCVACHRDDDSGAKGHKGQFGEKCESCHDAKAWKPSTFRHDTDTRYPLRFKHRTARCTDCHTGPLFRTKTSSECVACHRDDDKHKGTLGRDCAACHTERDWKERARFDHDKTAFPLLGRHADVRCDACHKSTLFKEAPKTCVACHRQDDKHRGTLGESCGDCHGERDWKSTQGRFDHDRTKFKLRNAHALPTVRCAACHADAAHLRDTPTACDACHRKDDKHEGQLGRDCGRCHDDNKGWKVRSFDHARARFALVGRHVAVACKDCHKTARFQDAPRDCVSCHRQDDKHKLAFGTACASCHNARAWSLWDFDHDRRSGYRLDGAHRRVACEACHTKPAPAGRDAAPLATNCLACHRGQDTHDGAFGARCEQCHVTESWKRVSNRTTRRESVQ